MMEYRVHAVKFLRRFGEAVFGCSAAAGKLIDFAAPVIYAGCTPALPIPASSRPFAAERINPPLHQVAHAVNMGCVRSAAFYYIVNYKGFLLAYASILPCIADKPNPLLHPYSLSHSPPRPSERFHWYSPPEGVAAACCQPEIVSLAHLSGPVVTLNHAHPHRMLVPPRAAYVFFCRGAFLSAALPSLV